MSNNKTPQDTNSVDEPKDETNLPQNTIRIELTDDEVHTIPTSTEKWVDPVNRFTSEYIQYLDKYNFLENYYLLLEDYPLLLEENNNQIPIEYLEALESYNEFLESYEYMYHKVSDLDVERDTISVCDKSYKIPICYQIPRDSFDEVPKTNRDSSYIVKGLSEVQALIIVTQGDESHFELQGACKEDQKDWGYIEDTKIIRTSSNRKVTRRLPSRSPYKVSKNTYQCFKLLAKGKGTVVSVGGYGWNLN